MEWAAWSGEEDSSHSHWATMCRPGFFKDPQMHSERGKCMKSNPYVFPLKNQNNPNFLLGSQLCPGLPDGATVIPLMCKLRGQA